MWATLATVHIPVLEIETSRHFTDKCTTVTPKQTEGLMKFVAKLQAYAPHFKGPVPVEGAVRIIRELWERASIETGYAGVFVSQFGNKQWV